MSNEELKKEVKTEINKTIENYGKVKKEVPQLGWGGIIGQKDFIRGITDAFRSPYDIARGSMDMVKSAFKPKQVRRLPTDSTDGHERFNVAKEYYGLDDNDIKERIKASCFIFYLTFIAIIADFSLYFYISWTSGKFITLAIFPTLTLFMWLMTQCFKYGLINYQMRTQSLCNVKEYLKKNEHWFPPLNGGSKFLTFLIAGLPMFMFGGSAQAAGNVSDSCGDMGNSAASISVEKVLSIPCSKDLWLQSLARIFPNVGPLADVQTGVTQTYGVGFVSALAAFVAILNAVAVGTLSYQSVIAVVNTAVEGETMGQKWHKVWAPVRIGYGFGMLAPITKGGVCMAQVFVLYISLWSGNWGNIIYNSYLYGISNPTKVDSSYTPPNTVGTLTNLVNLNVCWASQYLSLKSDPRESDILSKWEGGFSTDYTENPQRTVIQNGDKVNKDLSGLTTLYDYQKYRWDFMNCGYLEAKKQNSRIDKIENTFNIQWNPLAIRDISTGLMAQAFSLDSDEKTFFRARAEAINSLNGEVHNTIQDIISSLYSPHTASDLTVYKDPFNDKLKAATSPGGNIDKAFQRYNNSIISAANTLMESNGQKDGVFDSFKQTVNDNGWMVAGAYYMTTTRMTDQIRGTISEEPKTAYSSGDDAGIDQQSEVLLGGDGKNYLDHLKQSFSQMYGNIKPIDESNAISGARNSSVTGHVKGYSFDGIFSEYMRGGFQAGWDYACNGLQTITFSALEKIAAITPGNGAAFQQMINFGHDLIDIAYVIAILAGLLSQFGPLVKLFSGMAKWLHLGGAAASALTGNIAAAGEEIGQSALSSLVEKNVSSIVTGVILFAGLVLGLGATYAYIFPMLPYINFLFFEQGSMVLVAECVIAAPILAYLHVRGEGEQLVDQTQRTGYLILFNLFLRIPLGVFGLILSVAIFETSIWLNAMLFKVAMNATIASNASGPVGTIAFLCLLMYTEWSLAIKSFSLISTLPEKISRWFGAQAESHGEAQGMRDMLAFGVAQISNRAQGFAGKQIGKMASGAAGKNPKTPTPNSNNGNPGSRK